MAKPHNCSYQQNPDSYPENPDSYKVFEKHTFKLHTFRANSALDLKCPLTETRAEKAGLFSPALSSGNSRTALQRLRSIRNF